MKRRTATRPQHPEMPTLIGAGITEMYYFKHLRALLGLRLKVRPRFCSGEHIHTLEKRIRHVLDEGGRALVVFDADVSTWNEAERTRLAQLRHRYADHPRVTLCDSLPSIEYWFLLHYAETNRHLPTSKAAITELLKHLRGFTKGEKFLEKPQWVAELTADGKTELALKRAKAFGTAGGSYSNVWKALEAAGFPAIP